MKINVCQLTLPTKPADQTYTIGQDVSVQFDNFEVTPSSAQSDFTLTTTVALKERRRLSR